MTKCEHCKWWKRVDSVIKSEIGILGKCRLNPPVVVHSSWGTRSEWPTINSEEMCSHYKPKSSRQQAPSSPSTEGSGPLTDPIP
jgi:hypothetical protein